jgi:hypothetical protein
VKPTSARSLIAAALVALGLAYLVLRTIYNSLPAVPRLAPVSVLLIGLVELQASTAVRARLDGRPGTRPILPIAVARFAALAKASSLAGAVIGGAWAAVVIYTLPRVGELRVAGRDALTAGLGVAASAVLVVGALLLERSCRVRRPPDGRQARRDHPAH